uniref:Dymeclin n=2 Tax=Amphimedon queenslandica TaxID=400682 RepID=A0AAN0IQV4_AMPQE
MLPLLKELSSEGKKPSHHSYMLLIILLILSQDECFNKSVHEITVKNITWASEKSIPQTTLGSLMIIVLVRTVHRNIQHLRDKFLHTNCLATLANMSSHFHSLSLEAAEKIVNLFRVLSRKYLKSKGEPIPAITGAQPTSPTTRTSPTTPTELADTETLQEILLMLLEIINSNLTYTLHVNPHFVYSLLYQREIFTPYHGRPGFIDLVNNIEMVIAFFANNVEKDGTPPFSAQFVTDIIKKYSKTWPRSRLRKFSELKFRYVEESQPDEFFVPYVWSLVQKHSHIHFEINRKSSPT